MVSDSTRIEAEALRAIRGTLHWRQECGRDTMA